MQRTGLDPVKNDRKVRDVMLSNCPYSERIETTTNKIRDLQVVK
jgi:23S rRNA G2445 N2-methylase RlmL